MLNTKGHSTRVASTRRSGIGLAAHFSGWLRGHGFATNVGYTFLAQIWCFALNLASSVIIARSLGPNGKGVVSVALLLPNMLCLMLNVGIGPANVYFVGSRRFRISVLSSNAVALSLLAATLGGGIVAVLFGTGWVQRIVPGVPTGLLLFALLILPLLLLNASLSGILQGNQKITTLNFIGIVQAFSGAILNVVFVAWMKAGQWGAVFVSLLASAWAVMAAVLVLRRDGFDLIPRWQSNVVRSTIGYGIKNYVANLLQFFNYRLDLLLVNYFLGATGVGFYTISVGMAEMLWYLPNSVAFVMFPKSAAETSEAVNRLMPRVLKFTVCATLVGAVGLAVCGKYAIGLIFSSRFLPSYWPMVALLPGVVFLGASKVLTAHIAGRGFPVYNSWISAIALVATVVLDFLLVPKHGVLGASFASSLAYLTHLLASVYFYGRVVHKSETHQEAVVSASTAIG